jgi:hypothetical protein
VPLSPVDLEALDPGDVVLLEGQGVEDRAARLVRCDGDEGVFAFLNPLQGIGPDRRILTRGSIPSRDDNTPLLTPTLARWWTLANPARGAASLGLFALTRHKIPSLMEDSLSRSPSTVQSPAASLSSSIYAG